MAGLTSSSTLSGQFRNYFSKELLNYAVQELKLYQFAQKAAVPKKAGAKGITMFRWSAPSITDIQALSEGTSPSVPSTSHQLALASISKSLAQYGQTVVTTDINKMTELFNSTAQAIKVTGQNFQLWTDSVLRNVLVGSNLTASNGSIGSAVEGSPLDNSDTLIEVYGQPGTTTQSYTGLNSATTDSVANDVVLLDLVTKLKLNRAPELSGGGYAYVTSPRVARELMRSTNWLDVSKYSNAKALFKGEVGSLYGIRVIEQTNPFISKGSATAGDRYIFDNTGGGGTGTGKDIIVSFAMGGEAFGCPEISGESAAAPEVDILDKADKSDPHNQRIVVAAKTYFAGLRLNPNWYIVHRSKSSFSI